MKITPVQLPTDIKQVTTNNSEARTRAINALMGQAPAQVTETPVVNQTAQEHPVANPNNISPEEVSAIKPRTTEVLDNPTASEDTPKAPVEVKDPETERKFAEIARQERILRAKAQKQAAEIKAQQDAIAAERAALSAERSEFEKGYISKDRLKADPLAALAEAEMSYETLTERVLNDRPRDPRVDAEIVALRNEIKSLKLAGEENQKLVKQQQTEQYQAAVKQIEKEAQALVKAEPETFEAISKTDSIKDVVELIERTYKEDGILLSVEEAANEVENYLLEEGMNVFKIEKIKKRLAEANASTAEVKQVQQTPAKTEETKPTMKTLTNATASTRKLSARERALLAFKGELKS